MTKHFSLMALLASVLVMVSCGGEEPAPEKPKTDEEPSLSIDSQMTVDGKSSTYSIPFQLQNPVSGTSVKTSTDCDWVYALRAETDKLMFKVSSNLGVTRTADINVTYGADIKKTVSLTQERFAFESFDMEVKDISARAAKLTISPKGYKGNYFFEILSKSRVNELNAFDLYSIGDREYGDALANDDLEYLKEMAAASKVSLADFLSGYPAMYKVTENGESLEMEYSDLRAGKIYYALCYGMDLEGNRQTEICLFEFTTASATDTDLTFDDTISNVTQNSARVTIIPSNNDDTYYWTYASETDMAMYSLEVIMDNMCKNVVDYANSIGASVRQLLSKGQETLEIDGLSMGTSYTIVAWGMDPDGNNTTPPQQLSTFRTKTNDVTDDCTFSVDVLEIEAMDVKVMVTPSNESTKYYVGFIDEKKCTNYSDYQMVQRIINMEADRLESSYYGSGMTWDDLLYSGQQTKWGRKNLGWTFDPEHSYRIYVFGVDSNGNVTTKIYRDDVTTAAPESSTMSFEVSLNPESTWHVGVFDIKPSNEDDYYMPFLVKTSDLASYRYADGSLMERELMDKIRDIYEDEITQYVFRKAVSFENVWTSDDEYSLILFGYAGSNTTSMYEFKFKSPAIPFGKADCDIDYTYELFNGDDLYAMDPVVWANAKGDCVMKVNITVKGNPANYYFGLWPPKENYLASGGIDHLVTISQIPEADGDNIINKPFGLLKPWWGGSSFNSGIFETAEGEVLDAMPWSITAFAEDADRNYGPLHYELFIPDKKPEDQVTGKYHKGYTQAYDFWSSPSATNVKTLVITAPKVELNK